jgi:RimJ/RimL family protein N-acetyltransferase
MSGMARTIRGVTILLERWTEDDLPLVQALVGDPVMMEHLGGPEAPDKIVERHRRYVDAPDAYKIVLDGVGAGWVGFWEHEWQGEQIYEIGWAVLPAHQGRGVAHTGTMLALELARSSDGPRSVHAFPGPDNGPSNAICRKCGFTLVGEVQVEFPKGHWVASNDWMLTLDAPAT